MKSQERHKLKTNKLAELLGKLPEYLEVHGKNLFVGVVVVLVILIGGWLWYNQHSAQREQMSTELTTLVINTENNKGLAVANSRDAQKGQPYNPDAIVANYTQLSEEASGTLLAMNAMLEEAQTVMSKLYYTNWPMTDEQQREICDRAEKIYHQVMTAYPENANAQGRARLGLGLVAEDCGDWDKAKSYYTELVSDKDGRYAGTVVVLTAEQRLKQLNGLEEPIAFKPAPVEVSAPVSGPAEGPVDDAILPTPSVEPSVPATPATQEKTGQDHGAGQ